MKATFALALACLLLADGALAGGLLKKYQPPRQGRRLAASDELLVITTVAFGDNVVACKVWDPDTMTWDWPSNPTEFTAAGKAQPPAADVKKLSSLICSDPEAAGDQIRTAVQAGGSQAQAAVYAIFTADCPSEDAASEAYGAAIDAVNSGDPDKVDAVSSWFTNFAKAADEVGIPVCMSLAVVDTSTAEPKETRDFHATGPAPAAKKSSRKASPAASKTAGRR
ncbi:Holliday junction ATP-dependent DNA helicase isoform B [Chlorella sorokiniana]|uniref:Holliday junction ATP-dependent DNA helicase isoform A n=1 Tax=Chlorella sorokiniana TaxID=3076 RepID=A0A2P6U0S4_CHLSO|nr:Holliday junction ATP-dependent DNA helicase isoform A [Chlorella sorokiniana]PRW59917.1 Holliday junction ATP-dependent DNA helicase isoform B [Chlorella sorokiniana]|eukprot:PRW59916.1 Holliday junction ATP-dependent DNA helicase isoform A [Chlorella sorokiniana]